MAQRITLIVNAPEQGLEALLEQLDSEAVRATGLSVRGFSQADEVERLERIQQVIESQKDPVQALESIDAILRSTEV